MIAKTIAMSFMLAVLAFCGFSDAAQEKPKSGTVIGALKSQKDSKDGKNTIIEVLAPGEEKPRSYHVLWDAAIKAPMPAVLKAVRAGKVGDRVELTWVGTNHGPAITAFKVLR